MSTAPDSQQQEELKVAATEDRKRKSEDEGGICDDGEQDEDDDDSYDSEEDCSDSEDDDDDDEELEALQRLSDQIQEAKAVNQKLKATLLAHQSKKQKKQPADEPDHSQRDFVAALFAARKAEQAKKQGDTIA